MKRLARVIAGAAAPLFLIGALLAGIGWAMGAETSIDVPVGGRQIHVGWDGVFLTDWGGPSRGQLGTETERELDAFTGLEVELSVGDVTVSSGETYGIRLHSGSWALKYSLEDGVLRIWDERPAGMQFSERGGSVEVFLPDGAVLADADITSAMGGLELKDIRAEDLTARTDLGDITALGLTVSDRLTVTSRMGGVSLEGELGETVSVTADMGDISAVSARDEQWYGYELSTDMGEITVNGERRGASASGKGEQGTMELHSGMGGITVCFA